MPTLHGFGVSPKYRYYILACLLTNRTPRTKTKEEDAAKQRKEGEKAGEEKRRKNAKEQTRKPKQGIIKSVPRKQGSPLGWDTVSAIKGGGTNLIELKHVPIYKK